MNIYLIEMLSKWVSMIMLSVASIIGISSSDSVSHTIENTNQVKDLIAETIIIPYETEYIYNSELSKGTEVVVQDGIPGVAYIINGEKEIIKDPIVQKIEIGTKEKTVFTGKMTGYGSDCVGCSGSGNLSCRTKNGTTHSLVKNGEKYNDSEYGNVHILAAALEKFSCGTIIKVIHPNLGTFNAIVLDTGSAMQNALTKGYIHMDLAYVTEKNKDIYLSTTNNAKYEVLRWGW